MRLGTGLLLIEPGQAAPAIELRDTAANGNAWSVGISGWTIGAAIERPVERGRRFLASVSITPYNANSSRRIYRDGVRARDLEYDSGAYALRAGMRIRAGEHSTTEVSASIGRQVIGKRAPVGLRDAWRSPYAGLSWSQRYRRVSAEDPFANRIHGFELQSLAEVYGGKRTWSRLTLSESAGRPAGRLHLRQTATIFAGRGLDRVSAFSIGGSWDVLGATAVYGSHYAEYRPVRGIVLNGGADYAMGRSCEVGARLSVVRAPSITRQGAALQTTLRAAGLRFTAGAAVPLGGEGEKHTIVYAMVSAARFER
ncbi:MAG: hypothetical protein QOC81_3224 [Thermoanaerobaculia bacterium]|jgi:hypothetical protein|nr:hypothetical protein [Thermoanaerobaculia bacterium]